MTDKAAGMGPQAGLQRALTLGPLILYGMGVIVGAGIYVSLGAVVKLAGAAAPISFLIAGLSAALTGLCYAELSARFPEAAGAASYVRHGFKSEFLGTAVGVATTVAAAVAAASIARGAVGYLQVLVPVGAPLLTTLLVVSFTGIAIYGVKTSVGIAAFFGALEVVGLIAATAFGLYQAPEFHASGIIPVGGPAWLGTMSGAFIAYFAFIGFETLVNMAEEVRNPTRIVPLGIVCAVGASVVLYVAVALAVVLSDTVGQNAILALFDGKTALVFATVVSVSIANGILVEIVMLSRLFYGMANAGQLPQFLDRINPTTRTPVLATVTAGAIVLLTALLVPFERLLFLANALTLAIFLLVDVSLLLVQRRGGQQPPAFAIPPSVPPAAALLTTALLAAGIFG